MQKQNWSEYDEKLIYRGEIIFDLEFLDRYELDLIELNKNKEGSPYKFTKSYILFVGIVKNTFSMPYRQLEGFTRGLHNLISAFPTADYSGLRKRVVKLDLLSYLPVDPDDRSITIAVELLIDEGADVNAKGDDDGQTAISYAAEKGHTEIIKALIDAGSDVDDDTEMFNNMLVKEALQQLKKNML